MALTDNTGREHGQAAAEYVGLITLVALALAALAVLVPRPAHKMLSIVEQAICTGLGRGCEIGGEESLALEPCPVRRSTDGGDLHATVMSVRAGSGRTALVEELSDGSATVTLADRGELAAEGGVGASVAGRGRSHGARAEASAGLTLGAGRGYEFAGVEEALGFVEDHRASTASLAAPLCNLCRLAGGGPELPDPDFTYREGGAVARLGAEAGAGVARAGATAVGSGAEGRRVDHRTGEVTSYHRVRGDVAAELGGPVAGTAGAGMESLVEYTTAADGTPLELLVRSRRPGGGRVGHAVRGAAGEAVVVAGMSRGDLVEEVASLDLGDARDRRAAKRFVDALGPTGDALALPARARALTRRVEAGGELELRSFSTVAEESRLSGDAALAVKLGASVARRATDSSLTSAYTSPSGATLFLERTDCLG